MFFKTFENIWKPMDAWVTIYRLRRTHLDGVGTKRLAARRDTLL